MATIDPHLDGQLLSYLGEKMTKSELIEALAEKHPHLPIKEVEAGVKTISTSSRA